MIILIDLLMLPVFLIKELLIAFKKSPWLIINDKLILSAMFHFLTLVVETLRMEAKRLTLINQIFHYEKLLFTTKKMGSRMGF